VLERNCVNCHEEKENQAKAPNLAREPIQNQWYASYNSLVNYASPVMAMAIGPPRPLRCPASKLVQLLTRDTMTSN